jgi:probable F420-dependent oxidoreductase
MSCAPGVISFTDRLDAAAVEQYARRIEALGYDSIWIPELTGREPLSTAAWLLARTTRLGVATGIANVYARDGMNAAQARHTLAELSGGRFSLGLGVSHPPMAQMRGQEWVQPVPKLRAYLETIRDTRVDAPAGPGPAPVYIAAHGPGLLKLAARLADGALTYLMPLEHTPRARETLGRDKKLIPLLPFVLDDDRSRALDTARKALGMYMALPAYRNRWQTFGFGDSDLADGGSERLLDALGAFGDEKRVRERLAALTDAGADQILLSPLHSDTERPGGPPSRLEALEALAPTT